MHEDYEDYDDEHDYDDLENKYKHYFKFDPEAWDAWGKMLYNALNDIVESSSNVWYVQGFPFKSIPVSSYISNTGKDKTFQYLGNNYYNNEVWKKKYFVIDKMQSEYINHISSNVTYFLRQPHYYKSLFDILN